MSNNLADFVLLLTKELQRTPTIDETYEFIFGDETTRQQILRDGKALAMLEINKYMKKPFEVQAIQVTGENLYDVAKWCQGDMSSNGNEKFIKVRVIHAVSERQTQAFIGDWVLYAGTSYRVYTDKAFQKSFELVKAKTDPALEGSPLSAEAFSSSS